MIKNTLTASHCLTTRRLWRLVKSSPQVEEPPKVDETPKVEAASIIGDWTTQPSCRWNSSTTNYESVLVKISADKIQVLRTHFADTDNNCSQSSVSSSADEYSYSLGENSPQPMP